MYPRRWMTSLRFGPPCAADCERGRVENRNARSRRGCEYRSERPNLMSTILLIILVLLLVGALPSWGHSAKWGYGPSGGLGLVLVIVLILVLMGRI